MDETDEPIISLYCKTGAPIGKSKIYITNSHHFIKLSPNILRLVDQNYTWKFPDIIHNIYEIDSKKQQFIVTTSKFLFIIQVEPNSCFSLLSKDQYAYKANQYNYDHISILPYGKRKVLLQKLYPFSLSLLRIGRKNKIKRKKKIENYMLGKYISYSCIIQHKNNDNISDCLIISKELFESLFGLNSSIQYESMLLLGTFCGYILSIEIPNERIQGIHKELIKMDEPILKILSTKVNTNSTKGDDILIIIGCNGLIKIIKSNQITDYPGIITQTFNVCMNIQDVFITSLSTLIYLSNGKIYFVDIINRELSVNNIVNSSIVTLLLPIQFISNLYFKSIGYIKNDNKWYTIDSNGLYYSIKLLSSEDLRNNQNSLEDINSTNIKQSLTKLSSLSESQKACKTKEIEINELLILSGKLCRMIKYKKNNFSIDIKVNKLLSNLPIHVEDDMESFIIEIQYIGNENIQSKYWRAQIHFECYNIESSVTIVLPDKWNENCFSFKINNPINESLYISPLTVTVLLVLNYPTYPSSIIYSSSHTFTMLDFHDLSMKKQNSCSYSILKAIENQHSIYHTLTSSEYDIKSENIKFILTAPISIGIKPLELLEILYHQRITSNDRNSEFIESTSQSKSSCIETLINRIIDNKTQLPLLSISLHSSRILSYQIRLSILISLLTLYPKVEELFWKYVKENEITEAQLNIIYKQIHESLFSLELSKFQSDFINLQSKLYNIKDDKIITSSMIEYYNLQQDIIKQYFEFRNKTKQLLY